jgi:hypothetical protein
VQNNIIIGGGACVQTIIVYKPEGEPFTFIDPTKVNVDGGILTFYWIKEISGKVQKVVTNLPFFIQDDINAE